MELILTGRAIDAREAERIGLVTRVVPAEKTLPTRRSRSPPQIATHATARGDGGQGGRSTEAYELSLDARPRDRAAALLRPLRDEPTRRRAWPRSSRSGRRAGRAADGRRPPVTRRCATTSRTRWRRSRSTGPTRERARRAPSSASCWRRFAPRARTAPSACVILTGAGRGVLAPARTCRSRGRRTRPPSVDGPARPLQPPDPGDAAAREADHRRHQRRRRGRRLALALACDLRIAADTATFVLAFGRVGLVPDSGTTWFLPRLVGPASAAELRFSATRSTRRRRGTVGPRQPGRPGRGLAAEARALALRLAAAAPQALALDQGALNRSLEAGLEEQLEREARSRGSPAAPPTTARASPRSWTSARRGSPGSSRPGPPLPPGHLDPPRHRRVGLAA